MTSIAHPVLPGAVPAIGGASAASTEPVGWFRPAGSKAVRVGLGVAIAAVMAGDVYAVLRSPVAEGRGVGSPAAATAPALEDAPAVNRFASTAGHVAVNPFSDAAYGAALGQAQMSPFTAVAHAATPAAPAASVAPGSGPSLPAAPTPRIVLPTTPAGPALTSPAGPASPADTGNGSGNGADNGDNGTTPDPSPLAPVTDPVVGAVQDVPVVGPTVAPVVEQVVEAAPVDVVDPVVSQLPVSPASLPHL